MSHTPGPWEISDQLESPFISVYANGDETIICDVVSEDVESWPEVEANARLIVAAPDLLTALREFVAMNDRHYNPSPGTWDAAVVMARAALAKAEGR